MQTADIILKDVRLPAGRVADVSIANGRVVHIGAIAPCSGGRVINCHGRLGVPAATDMHVHMRDGYQSAKEDWRTGTEAAVAGGVTMVVDQPNTIPPMDSVVRFNERVRLAEAQALCRFAVNGSVTETADIAGVAAAGALAFGEMFAAPSSYGSALSAEVITRASAEVGRRSRLLTVHAEEVQAGAVYSLAEHAAHRPASGEVATIELVNHLVPANTRLHFCHLSSAESIDAVRPGATFEVAPHHLFLSMEDGSRDDTHRRMNPPLRSRAEQQKLFARFADIMVIASDHAPHTLSEKKAGFSEAPSGVPGVETMMPLLMNAAYEHRLPLDGVIRKTVANPNRILNIESPGFVPGARADFAVYADKPVRISGEKLHSKCGWTPYEGMSGLFPVLTLTAGRVVFEKGEFFEGGAEWVRG